MSEADIVTFGCRLNAYESEAMRERLRAEGIGDAVIVNTCAVTAEAVRQSKQTIRRLKREKPERRVIVTGCAAQVKPELYSSMEEVDLVLGNTEKFKPENFRPQITEGGQRVRVSDIMAVTRAEPQSIESFEGRARAYLQVQNGCDHRCTFCIIPYGRGPSRSIKPETVIASARRLAQAGYGEIVLTGVDLTSYGADLPNAPKLGMLVRRLLLDVPEIKRLRLSSFDAIEMDDSLMRVIAEEQRLMPFFHLSVQAGDNMILKRMKRRHSREDIIRFCADVRAVRPDAQFGADFITGFPTETEEMFANTMKLVDEAGLTQLHVFPFSPREGTPAAKMPQLDRGLIKARAKRLREKGEAAFAARMARMVGTEQDLLVEKDGVGRTRCFLQASYTGPAEAGSFIKVRITGYAEDHLLAEFIGVQV